MVPCVIGEILGPLKIFGLKTSLWRGKKPTSLDRGWKGKSIVRKKTEMSAGRRASKDAPKSVERIRRSRKVLIHERRRGGLHTKGNTGE